MNDDALDAAMARARARRRLPAPPARKLLRQGSGLSQQDVATALGVTREAVAQWEAGRRTPRALHLESYLAILEKLAAPSP
jgi:DNA-binding transcriptional regulator YiaG